jgi:predicted PurR-regulated permease PerM
VDKDVSPDRRAEVGFSTFEAVVVGGALVAAITLGRAMFIPCAIAVLLSFVLNPLVQFLKRIRVGRVLAVLIAVGLAFAGIVGLGFVIARQVTELAGDLPLYEATLAAKIQSLRGLPVTTSVLEKANRALGKLGEELEPIARPDASNAPARNSTVQRDPDKPIPVEIRQPPLRAFDSFQRFLATALVPLATGGLVLLLVICILLQREDLRDRVIRLVGARDLERTTRAMDDAAGRLSQFYLAQTLANGVYGSILSIGLALIGVPNPVLWGILAAVLRFVPTLGGPLAAALPIAIATAVDPHWTMAAETAALYLVAELIMGQRIEPRLRSRSTGLSPLAGILATMFWTWAWGPIGLILATPLTVLLIVLGKHVDSLGFLEIILGAEPALTPQQTFYQRLLAGDSEEAASQAEHQLQDRKFVDYADQIAIPGLHLAQVDWKRGALNAVRMTTVLQSLEALTEYLAEDDPVEDKAASDSDETPALEKVVPRFQVDERVIIVGARTPLDQAAGVVLQHVLYKENVEAEVVGAREVVVVKNAENAKPVGLIALSYLDGLATLAHSRFLLKRIERTFPGVPVVVCVWNDAAEPSNDSMSGKLSGQQSVATMGEAKRLILSKLTIDLTSGANEGIAAPLAS